MEEVQIIMSNVESQPLVLVFNCGSSSIKFAIIEPESGANKLNGLVQCIGSEDAELQWRYGEVKQQCALSGADYTTALNKIVELIQTTDELMAGLVAVGHRVVHGGESFTKSALLDDQVLAQIRACCHLAPLHNPANLTGIIEARRMFPQLKQVAVFDTAFHQTMPQHAFTYAVPYEWYEKHAVRRYGFHGTSHLYVTQTAAVMLDKPLADCAFISAHLGNGCSVAAVLGGESLDTSMGITPLEGLVMGTRSGDLDPGLIDYLASALGYDACQITTMLNKNSGLLGISGVGSDMRVIERECDKGNTRAQLALEVFCYRLAKYIMAYTVPLGRLDALIFTGGIGENGSIVRAKVLNWLGILGFKVDVARNNTLIRGKSGIITCGDSPVAMVVPTNEELVIARDTLQLI